MSTKSPGPATNSGTAASTFEAKASDPGKSGKEKLGLDSSNGTAQMAAHSFEQRVASDPGH